RPPVTPRPPSCARPATTSTGNAPGSRPPPAPRRSRSRRSRPNWPTTPRRWPPPGRRWPPRRARPAPRRPERRPPSRRGTRRSATGARPPPAPTPWRSGSGNCGTPPNAPPRRRPKRRPRSPPARPCATGSKPIWRPPAPTPRSSANAPPAPRPPRSGTGNPPPTKGTVTPAAIPMPPRRIPRQAERTRSDAAHVVARRRLCVLAGGRVSGRDHIGQGGAVQRCVGSSRRCPPHAAGGSPPAPPRFPTGSARGAAITRRPACGPPGCRGEQRPGRSSVFPAGVSHVPARCGVPAHGGVPLRIGPSLRGRRQRPAGGGLVSASAFAFGSQDGVAGVARARGSGRGARADLVDPDDPVVVQERGDVGGLVVVARAAVVVRRQVGEVVAHEEQRAAGGDGGQQTAQRGVGRPARNREVLDVHQVERPGRRRRGGQVAARPRHPPGDVGARAGGAPQRGRGDVDRGDHPSAAGQPERVGAFAAA